MRSGGARRRSSSSSSCVTSQFLSKNARATLNLYPGIWYTSAVNILISEGFISCCPCNRCRRERMLEIMRDSRLGTHGGLALIFVLVAKVLVVSEVALRGTSALAALAAACAVGRGMAGLLMYRQRYAREEGRGNLFIGKITLRQMLITMGIALALATLLLGVNGLRAALITLVLVWALGQALKRTLGGQTGDTLGAAIELGEVIFLLALL